MYCIVLSCTVLYCTELCCTVMYCTFPLQEEGLAKAKIAAAISGVVPKDANPVQQYKKIPLADYINILSTHFNYIL